MSKKSILIIFCFCLIIQILIINVEADPDLKTEDQVFFLYKMGISYMAEGEVGEAIRCWEIAVDKDPSFSRVHYLLYKAYEKQNDPEMVFYHKTRYEKLEKDNYQINELYEKALAEYMKKNYSSAIKSFNLLLKKDPYNSSVLFLLGSLYSDMGDFKNSAICYQKLLKIVPDNRYALYDLAYDQYKLKKYKEAEKILKKLLTLEDDTEFRIAYLKWESRHYIASVNSSYPVYSPIVALKTIKLMAKLMLGEIYRKQKNYKMSVYYLRSTDIPFDEIINNTIDKKGFEKLIDEYFSSIYTGSEMDITVTGDDFIGIKLPDGRVGYIKSCSLTLSKDKNNNTVIVTESGYPLIWSGKYLDDSKYNDILIQNNGLITVADINSCEQSIEGRIIRPENVQIGRIKIVSFESPEKLKYLNGMFFETPGSGPKRFGGKIETGQILRSSFLTNEEINDIININLELMKDKVFINEFNKFTAEDNIKITEKILSSLNQSDRYQRAALYLDLADQFILKKEFKDAIKAYKDLAELLPDDIYANMVAGINLIYLEPESSLKYLLNAHDLVEKKMYENNDGGYFDELFDEINLLTAKNYYLLGNKDKTIKYLKDFILLSKKHIKFSDSWIYGPLAEYDLTDPDSSMIYLLEYLKVYFRPCYSVEEYNLYNNLIVKNSNNSFGIAGTGYCPIRYNNGLVFTRYCDLTIDKYLDLCIGDFPLGLSGKGLYSNELVITSSGGIFKIKKDNSCYTKLTGNIKLTDLPNDAQLLNKDLKYYFLKNSDYNTVKLNRPGENGFGTLVQGYINIPCSEYSEERAWGIAESYNDKDPFIMDLVINYLTDKYSDDLKKRDEILKKAKEDLPAFYKYQSSNMKNDNDLENYGYIREALSLKPDNILIQKRYMDITERLIKQSIESKLYKYIKKQNIIYYVENKKTDTEKKVLTIEEIKEILNSLLSLKNEISKRTYLIACSYFALGDHKNAENYFKTIINDCYYGELSRKMICKIYEINNNYSEAEKYYEEKSPEIAYIYVQTNRYDEALRYVKRFNYYYTYPDEVKKAYVYEKIGDYLTKNKMKIYAIDYYNKSKETVELIIRDTKPDNESKLKLENDINRLNEKVIR